MGRLKMQDLTTARRLRGEKSNILVKKRGKR